MTAKVINFPRHLLHRCRRDSPDCEGCLICDGGLALCRRCGGAESSMPTDCPGKRFDAMAQDMVSRGELDYRAKLGGWCVSDAAKNWRCL